MSRLIARSVVAVLMPVALLSACGGGDDATVSPPPEQRAALPTEAAPEEYDVRTVDGAEAFVYHWLTAFNRALGSGKAKHLQAVDELTAPSCDVCDLVFELVRDVHRGPGVVETTGWTWQPTKVTLLGKEKKRASVQGMLGISPVEVRRGTTQIERVPASRTLREFLLEWRDGHWVVTAAGKVGKAN